MEDPQWWQILAALSAAVGALAGAAGAVAAWRSAKASERTSRESRLALGAAVRPTLKVTAQELDERFAGRVREWAVAVYNISPWDAADVYVEARYRDGERIRAYSERIAANDAAPFAMALRPKDRGHEHDPELAQVMVRYSDGHRISRYESRYTYSYDESSRSFSVDQSHEQITIR
jgi:hypothetical protein